MAQTVWNRLWQISFATVVAAMFVWFCLFWSETFSEQPADAFAAAGSAPTGECAASIRAAVPIRRASPATASLPVHAGGPAGPQATMLRTHIFGPYALSVRDGLNEMLIDTHLIAQGVQAATDPNASLDSVMNAIPSQLPADGFITSGFGMRRSPFTGELVQHNGVDFAVGRGDPVFATADGVVVYAGWYMGLGKAVFLDHGFGIATRYGHNSALTVKVGDLVHRGEVIARAGSTGRSTGTHVHYEVLINDRPIDPAQFMFEVPDRAGPRAAAEAYAERYNPRLGLAMGGDEPANGSAHLKARKDADPTRLPWSLAFIGGFFAAALALVLSVIPRSE